MTERETEFTMNVCGLLFTAEDEPQVVLALRNDEELGDLYDGLGGNVVWPMSVDENIWEELPRKALTSHVYEQCGVVTTPEQWLKLISIRGDGFEIRFYATKAAETINARSPSPSCDRISLENPYILPANTISHLTWLVPLALDDKIQKPLGLQAL